MESCNSGSLQSSSGGEEEYDSRATFMSGGVPINPKSLPPLTPFFDPIASIYPPINSFISSHTTKAINDPLITNDNLNNNTTNYTPTNNNHSFPTTVQPPAATVAPAPRNPKKRSRASRRAPTTVLTTDTTNFQAMVQEFTGIPAPPFVSSSPFARNRLDLFPSSLDAPPSYLRRPFAQKLQSPVFPFLAGNNNVNGPVNGNTTSSTGNLQSSNVSSNYDQGFFLGSKVAAHHQHFGLSNSTTTFGGELANLISLSTNNNVSNAQDLVRTDRENGMRSNYVKRFDHSGPSSASNLDGEKRPENSGREGMVETWICSSSD